MPSAGVDFRAALRILAVLTLLATLLTVFGRTYVEALLPVYRVMLGVVQPDYRVRSLLIEGNGGSRIRVEMERQMLVKDAVGELRPAVVLGRASTQTGYVLLHPFILFGIVLVWPGLGCRSRLRRLAASIPLLLLLEALDIPLALAGGIEETLSGAGPSGHGPDWAHLLDGGGRYAISVAAAGVASVLETGWTRAATPA